METTKPAVNGRGKRKALVRTEHAKTWHIDEPTAPDGGPRYHKGVVRRVFTPEYKLAILAEYDRCSEPGEKGAILRREGLYSSLITDWRRQHRMGLLKAAVGRSDGGRGGPSLSEVAKLKAENERLKEQLAKARVVIEVQGKVHALLDELSKSADCELPAMPFSTPESPNSPPPSE
jgi:transposase-like protein